MEGDGDNAGGAAPKRTICREFFDTFPMGKERSSEKLVAFLQKHPASRIRVDEWLQQAASDREKRINQHQQPIVAVESNSCGYGNNQYWNKCNRLSTTERELGNANFKKKNLKKSLHHYNRAIKYACFPPLLEESEKFDDNAEPETCLAIALANRSAVYKELGDSFYNKALADADLAIKFGYPQKLKSKILFRKADIYVNKRDKKMAQESLNEIKTSLSSSSLEGGDDSSKKKLHDLEMQIEKIWGNPIRTEDNADNNHGELEENPDYEFASRSITIKTSETKGRHVVAVDDINEGRLLFREEPFASVLLTEFYGTHCHHCHVPLQDYEGEPYLFPCRRCPEVVFCSYECSEAAELYHRIECGWLDLLHSVGIAHLAMRIILIAGVDNVLYCADNHQSLTDLTNTEIFKTGKNNYQRVYSLLDHIPDIFEEDLFQYALTASLLTTFLLTNTKFLSGIGDNERVKVGGTLLRHICQLICNAHAIYDVLPEAGDISSPVVDESQTRVATAIFAAASIMNHSCDANITVKFVGKTLIVKAARPIWKDKNVYNCYGPQFSIMSRCERQENLLHQYFFNCDCTKCNYELKHGASFADQFDALKCLNCEGRVYRDSTLACPHCKVSHNLKITNGMYSTVCELLKKGEYLLDNNELDLAVETLESCYTTAEKILFENNSQFGKVCDSLARCYVMKGSPKSAQKYLEKSLKYVEARFGTSSPEYLRELKKFESLQKL